MSVKVMAAVWELDLPQNEKLILLALADHADDQGLNCHPSVARLAWKSGYSERQTQNILKSLRDKGIIEPIAFGRGGWRYPTHYAIHSDRGAKLAPLLFWRGEPGRGEGRGPTRQGVKPTAPRGAVAIASETSVTTRNPSEKQAAQAKRQPSPVSEAKDTAYQSYEARFGTKPNWDGGDYKQLAELFHRNPALTLDDFLHRWRNYLDSTEDFTRRQGHRLRYFCRNFDRFREGPLHERQPNGRNTPNYADQRTQQNLENLGLFS